MGNYWDMDHSDKIRRFIDRIDNLGRRSGWRDRDSEGYARNELLGLRVHGGLDRARLLAEMQKRGHDERALQRLNRLIDKTYKEQGPHPEVRD